jgi:hypothetical protein
MGTRLGTHLVAKTSSVITVTITYCSTSSCPPVGTIRSPEQLASQFDSTSLQLRVSPTGTAKTLFFSSPKAPDPSMVPNQSYIQ